MKTLDMSAEFQLFFPFLFSLLGVALQLLSFLTLRPGSLIFKFMVRFHFT